MAFGGGQRARQGPASRLRHWDDTRAEMLLGASQWHEEGRVSQLMHDVNAVELLPPVAFSETGYGRRAYITAGHGTPTVVFECGLGDSKEVWASVFDAVSHHTRVFAYDRAGYGQSAAATCARDGLQLVAELRAVLQAEKIAPPYVLVGHSLGGTLMQLFARSHPGEVAGVVLVDARHSGFSRRARKLGVHPMLVAPPMALLLMARAALRGELHAAPTTMRQARRAGAFPNVPLIVLTQRRLSKHWPQLFRKAWEASQRSLVKMSTLGRFAYIDDTGHHLHTDRPDRVVQAISSVVNAARYLSERRSRSG